MDISVVASSHWQKYCAPVADLEEYSFSSVGIVAGALVLNPAWYYCEFCIVLHEFLFSLINHYKSKNYALGRALLFCDMEEK